MSAPIEFPECTHHVDAIKTSEDLEAIIKAHALSHPTNDLYIDGVYENVNEKNVMNTDKFVRFCTHFTVIPAESRPNVYLLGWKNNEITADLLKMFPLSPDNIRAPGYRIVEAFLRTIDGELTWGTMVSPLSNFSADGKPQFSIPLSDIIPEAYHFMFPSDLLSLHVETVERLIHLMKAITPLLIERYSPNMSDPPTIARMKAVIVKHNLPATTWQEVNLAILKGILTVATDKEAKAYGQDCLCNPALFTDANGADTAEIPINKSFGHNVAKLGINAIKQALGNALRCRHDPEFFKLVMTLIKLKVFYVEAAIHGKYTDKAFGACYSPRSHIDCLATGDMQFWNAMGNGLLLLQLMIRGDLQGGEYYIELKPTNEAGDTINPEFFDRAIAIFVNKLTPA